MPMGMLLNSMMTEGDHSHGVKAFIDYFLNINVPKPKELVIDLRKKSCLQTIHSKE